MVNALQAIALIDKGKSSFKQRVQLKQSYVNKFLYFIEII